MTDAQEPVAWAVVSPSGGTRFLGVKKEDAQKEATASERVAAVYWPALTDAEREAIEPAIDWYSDSEHPEDLRHASTLRGLLSRCSIGSE